MKAADAPRAWAAPPTARLLVAVPAVALVLWAADVAAHSVASPAQARGLYLGSALLAAGFVLAAVLERPLPQPTAAERRRLDALSVAAVIPVFNEDPRALSGCLESLLAQTRPLQAIAVVDDGSDAVGYDRFGAHFVLTSTEPTRETGHLGAALAGQHDRRDRLHGVAVQQQEDVGVGASAGANGAAAYYRAALHGFADPRVERDVVAQHRAVHQPTAFAFTLVPERFGHHRRQQLRWMRGSLIRSLWRFRYLPAGRVGYWVHLVKWLQYVALTVLLVALVATGALLHPRLLVWVAAINVALHLCVNARYLGVRRNDQTTRQRLGVYLTSPLVALWTGLVLRPLRWWAMLTLLRLEWGTRRVVEVAACHAETGTEAPAG